MKRLSAIRCRARSEKLLHREGIELIRALTELAGHLDLALLPEYVADFFRTERTEQSRNAGLAATARELDRRSFEDSQIAMPEPGLQD